MGREEEARMKRNAEFWMKQKKEIDKIIKAGKKVDEEGIFR